MPEPTGKPTITAAEREILAKLVPATLGHEDADGIAWGKEDTRGVDALVRAVEEILAGRSTDTDVAVEAERARWTSKLAGLAKVHSRDLHAAFERDRWAGEWNSMPTAIDRMLAALADPDDTAALDNVRARAQEQAVLEASEAVRQESLLAHDPMKNRGQNIPGLSIARRILGDHAKTHAARRTVIRTVAPVAD